MVNGIVMTAWRRRWEMPWPSFSMLSTFAAGSLKSELTSSRTEPACRTWQKRTPQFSRTAVLATQCWHLKHEKSKPLLFDLESMWFSGPHTCMQHTGNIQQDDFISSFQSHLAIGSDIVATSDFSHCTWPWQLIARAWQSWTINDTECES